MRKHRWICIFRVVHDDHSVENVGEMAAIGLGLPQGTFKDAGRYGYVNYLPVLVRLMPVFDTLQCQASSSCPNGI